MRQRMDGFKKKLASTRHRLFPPTSVEIEGVMIPLGRHISNVIKPYLFDGSYELGELRLLQRRLTSDDVVMELGTGLGLLSCYIAKKIGSQNVTTYEGNPGLEEPIRKLYALNSVNPRLEMCILGKDAGFQSFYVEKDFWVSNSHEGSSSASVLQVPVKSFHEALLEINPTFLIIDIEGGEYELLRDGNLHNVKKIVMEIHPSVLGREKTESVLNFLSNLGFQVVDQTSDTELFFQRVSS